MGYLEGIVMGIVQGLTEFLPVSSSGHLAIFEKLFGMKEPGASFDVLLHVGTLVAVFIVYFSDIKKLIIEGFKLLGDFFVNIGLLVMNLAGSKGTPYRKVINSSYRKFVMLVIVSTIPTGIIGVLIKDTVEVAKTDLVIVGVCLLITACLLIICDLAEEGTKKPKNVTYIDAAAVGIAQGAATLPGISRSGTTIAVCSKLGFDRKFAVKYSFILSIPAILGAAVLEIPDFMEDIEKSNSIGPYIAGTIAAAVVGYICIRFLLKVVSSRKMKYFAGYCTLAGIASIIIHFVM
ncbi:MAG: undecaprenyl-diphosphate phosphatase [Lachnospiraceae bacterium]|nr:undecaprenyl-diphosphate phosphatase [Lachnospiraceae bacterium]